jgi:NAD(P)-dependent dehydrogenase (short-subunit alcohol dehydrogenase family)
MLKDLCGKTMLVTGATDGIGKAAVSEFAQRGASVTLVGRNPEKAERLLKELKAASGNGNLDLIRETPGARVVSTASAMQARGVLDLRKTPASLEGSGTLAYATSKLANVLFTKELQRRLEGTTATANCFHPGYVRSRFGGDLGAMMRLVFWLALPFSVSPEKGADSLIWLATSPEASSLKGEYVAHRHPVTPSSQARDPKLAADLWALSEKLCAEAAARENRWRVNLGRQGTS